MGYTPHVLVVGGGATGTGVARDLAMRGLEVTLVEEGTLASGTSGSMHALLHSGARYADDDPETAATCRRENAVLRDIADHLVTESGGLFASLPGDPDDYLERKRAACEAADVPVTELSAAEARDREPGLTPDVEAALAVPDAVIDPFRLCVANARSAAAHGADVLRGWRVVSIQVEDGAVDTVRLKNESPEVPYLSTEKTRLLDPDYVVNAAGPWAGDVAALAGLSVPIRHAQGAMVVTERAGHDTVLNRCRPRTHGDIAVPFGGASVLGTTDEEIDGPEDVDRDVDAVDFLVDELSALVPGVADARPFRAYWGVRALPADGDGATEKATRSFTIYNHERREDCWGISSVHGGKLTIHRHVAAQVTDHVCAKFGIDRPCHTADHPLPVGPEVTEAAATGGPPDPDPDLCPCVGVTRSYVRAVLDDEELSPEGDLTAVCKRTRAGMGACQGGRCVHRLGAELYPDHDRAGVDRNVADVATDRWRGRRFALWGEQFASASRTYQLHAGTMNRHEMPPDQTDPIEFDAFDAGPSDGDPVSGGESSG